MAADRSKYPVVHLVRQHPVGGCRSRVPYSRRSGWAPPPAPARRRDRHPQDLNPLFAGGSGRTPRNRASQKRGTLQVHALVGKVLHEIPRLTDRQDRIVGRCGKRHLCWQNGAEPGGTGWAMTAMLTAFG